MTPEWPTFSFWLTKRSFKKSQNGGLGQDGDSQQSISYSNRSIKDVYMGNVDEALSILLKNKNKKINK